MILFSPCAARAGCLAMLAMSPAHAQTASLSFQDAIDLALRDAPILAANTAQIEAARQSAIYAGALPDPKLIMGVENLPIEGADRFDFAAEAMTMRRVGVMQEFPNGAKRQAGEAAAQGREAMAEAELTLAQLNVRRETALAWIERASIESQLGQLEALAAENQLLEATVRANLVGGQSAAVDALLPRLEATVIDERRDELNTRRRQAIASLRRWIGAAADRPLSGSSPDWRIDAAALTQNLPQHPELAVFGAKSSVADAEVAAAQAAKKPDWALEFAYQYRASPYDDMVMLQVSFDLPVFARWRQNPQLAAKQAERLAVDAEQDNLRREHVAQLENELADYQRLTNALTRQRETVLPLAKEKSALVLAAWRGGKGNLTELIAARRERIDAELKAIALEGERKQLAAKLHYTYGDAEHAGDQP